MAKESVLLSHGPLSAIATPVLRPPGGRAGGGTGTDREPHCCPLSPLRPAFPLASLMPAESYSEYVDRCAVSVRQMVSSCPQDGECAQVRAAPAGGAHRWDARRIVF